MDGVMQGAIKDMNRAVSFIQLQKLPEGKLERMCSSKEGEKVKVWNV